MLWRPNCLHFCSPQANNRLSTSVSPYANYARSQNMSSTIRNSSPRAAIILAGGEGRLFVCSIDSLSHYVLTKRVTGA